jgi:hypothetical protein
LKRGFETSHLDPQGLDPNLHLCMLALGILKSRLGLAQRLFQGTFEVGHRTMHIITVSGD